jgi:rhamnosyltransferase subunit B
VKVALQPSVLRSMERPPWPLTQLVQGRLGGVIKRTVIPAIYKFGEIAAAYREHTNRFRNSVGLRRLPFGASSENEDLFLVLCPDWFAMPQKDWPARSRTTGFLYFDQEYHDKPLEEFIAANGAPLVFTPGTGVSDIETFFLRAEALCQELQFSGVFLSGALRCYRRQWADRIAVRDHAEMHWLLPRSRMLVHHGGIGTTAQAIRAGIPQIILPDRFDQPDNALRVAILGLGGAVFSSHPRVSDVAGIMRQVLASGTIRDQVKRAAALVRTNSSIDLVGEMIDGIVTRRYGDGRPAGNHLSRMASEP